MSRTVAIVGAGPTGCYLAQALLKARTDLAVDVIDRSPVPFGLVRYGVAADHQGTKAVQRQFARVFERQGARFVGNTTLGEDVTLEALREAYDAVVLAIGLSADRKLGVPGDDAPGVVGAGRLTRALNEHPDAEALPTIGARPVVVGAGNVAIDLVRVLAKRPQEFDGSDLGPGPTRWLAETGVETITLIARGPAAAARFDAAMIRELGTLSDVRIDVDADMDADVAADGAAAAGPRATLAALRAIDGVGTGARRIRFLFERRPVAVSGAAGVDALLCARPDGGEERIPATAVLTAIGFENDGRLDRDAILASLEPGLYAAGWFGRGPRGAIPDSRAEALALAPKVLADLDAAPIRPRRGGAIFADRVDVADYDGWVRIDAAETASPPPDRRRVKIADRAAMLRRAAPTTP